MGKSKKQKKANNNGASILTTNICQTVSKLVDGTMDAVTGNVIAKNANSAIRQTAQIIQYNENKGYNKKIKFLEN